MNISLTEKHRRFRDFLNERIKMARLRQTKAAYEIVKRNYETIHNVDLDRFEPLWKNDESNDELDTELGANIPDSLSDSDDDFMSDYIPSDIGDKE